MTTTYSTSGRMPRYRIFVLVMAAASVLTAAIGLGAFLASPAHAHDVLISTKPADGATVTKKPKQVSITMSAQILQTGAVIEVSDADGQRWDNEDTTVSGEKATVTLADDAPAGKYTATWRVVSSDGHPVSGEFAFSVKLASDAKSSESETAPDQTVTETQVSDNPTTTSETSQNPANQDADDSATSSQTTATQPDSSKGSATDASSSQDEAAGSNWGRTAIIALIGVAIGVGLFFAGSAIRRGRSS